MRLHLPLLWVLTAAAAQAAPPVFSGDVDRDFGDSPGAIRVGDPGGQELSFAGRVSGLDLDALVLWHDADTDVLYVGLGTHGIAGDVDGDGLPGGTSQALADIDGRDLPDFGGGESFAVTFDFNDDGVADVIAGVPGTAGLGGFTVARANGPFPPFAFGQPLPGHAGVVFLEATPRAPHLEFTVERFSQLPGQPGGGALGPFSVRAFMGSTEDAAIGDDWLPGQDEDQQICFDSDGDGVTTCQGDCRDGDADIQPGAIERCDEVDDDCDGVVDEDCVGACGDGVRSGAEGCDDGNLIDGDGCDSDCTRTQCGNGIQTAGERCDDGNVIEGDGCDSNCTLTGCGNGIATEGEGCDDGNAVDGDGCDNTCTPTACGNGVLTAGEQCDDGNLIDGDGCDAECQDECGDERCDGVDNDCDGRTDEGFALGEACETGEGACANDGVTVCTNDGSAIRCDAMAGRARIEQCDGADDDCDGVTDEGFQVGLPCAVGTGVCAAGGVRICTADGDGVCDATPGEPTAEVCNGLDDDCDGEVDEGDPPNGTVCRAGAGPKGGGCVDCDCRQGPDGQAPLPVGLLALMGLLLALKPRRAGR